MSFPFSPIFPLEKEAFVSCPFNNEHKMCESSLQRHIVRCMVNYPTYVSCPFNALHFFKTKQLLEEHIGKCPCKPIALNKHETDYQEELVHAPDLRKLRDWNKECEDWDKEDDSENEKSN